MSTCWERLKDHPFSSNVPLTIPIRINQHECVVMTRGNSIGSMDITKYNAATKTWKILHSFKSGSLSRENYGICYNLQNNCVYVIRKSFNVSQDSYIINLQSNNVKHCKVNICNPTQSCIIQSCLHVIDVKHFIYDISVDKLELSKTNKIGDFDQGLNWGGFVYLQTKDVVLYFGGLDIADDADIDTIHEYSVTDQIWRALSCTLPTILELVCCVVTSDEKYVLLLGGQTWNGYYVSEHNGILIYDVEKEEIRKSMIEVPPEAEPTDGFITISTFAAIAMQEDGYILVSGYLRGFEEIPMDIVHLIGCFIDMEYVYLMSKESNQNGSWKISVNQILNNLEDQI